MLTIFRWYILDFCFQVLQQESKNAVLRKTPKVDVIRGQAQGKTISRFNVLIILM